MSAELATEEILLVITSVVLVAVAGHVDQFKRFISRHMRDRRRS